MPNFPFSFLLISNLLLLVENIFSPSKSFSRGLGVDFCGESSILNRERETRKGTKDRRDGKYRTGGRRVESRASEASLVPVGIARFCYGEFCHGGRDPTCKHPCGQELRFGIRRR